MHVAIPLYPGFTALDAVGPYTVLAFAPGWTVTFVAGAVGPVRDDRERLNLVAEAAYAQIARPDVVLVPGGPGALNAVRDEELLSWLREAHEHSHWTASVCVGSTLLAAAGLLTGRRATGHWAFRAGLAGFGAVPVDDRVVVDGKVVTAAGVSAGIDMALALLARASDATTAKTVQLALEYDPRPPFDAGSPQSAPVSLWRPALDLIGPSMADHATLPTPRNA
ncbi:DJ-1/PfpI family protein [Glycomyces tenuis]|uniref:DJ-1/PfpI family protein n=1 Tax=Glycomyces tenuis TaxID=58116 RepID=UPI00041399A4|nr:DJ-1/PfpI family protein [Glycomyces tenuis]